MGSKGKKIEFESKKTKLKQKTPRIGARKPYSQGNKKILFPRESKKSYSQGDP